MFRDILVILGVKGVVASYALSFARHFDAEVTAVWPAQYPFETIGDAQTRYDLVAAAEEQAEEESAARTLEFVEQAHHFGVKAHTIANDFKRGEPRNLPHLARGFDLIVVEQPTPEQHAFAGGQIGSIVSGCGRPVLATPYIQKDPASFDKVVVAWDASASAARALGDAIPILKRAKSVEIVTVANGNARPQFAGRGRRRSASRTPRNSSRVQGDSRRNRRRRYAAFVRRGQRRQNDGHRRLWPFARRRDASWAAPPARCWIP